MFKHHSGGICRVHGKDFERAKGLGGSFSPGTAGLEIKMIDKKLAAGDVDRIFIRANQDRSEVLSLPLPCS